MTTSISPGTVRGVIVGVPMEIKDSERRVGLGEDFNRRFGRRAEGTLSRVELREPRDGEVGILEGQAAANAVAPVVALDRVCGGGDERDRGTDPKDPDTDDDGKTDGEEVNVLGTNPLVADSTTADDSSGGGGTTGLPKGVAVEHRAEMLNLYHVAMLLDFDPESVYFHQTPMFHAASMGGILGTLLVGGWLATLVTMGLSVDSARAASPENARSSA